MQIGVRSSMPTHEFYQSYFQTPVFGVYQRDKKIVYDWNPNLTVFQNERPSGILFFYQKPVGYGVKVEFKITTPGQKDPQNLARVMYAKDIMNEEQLWRLAFMSIRKPFEKALNKDYNTEEYLQMCK